MTKYYLTTPIYYVNAKPHVGSAYTTIAADVLARYRQQQGDDVRFITGTAEHGDKIAGSATHAGQTPQAFTDENSDHFKSAWERLNINYHDFIRTSEDRHAQSVKEFFIQLKASGQIYEGEYQGLYCVGHESFIKPSELDENGYCPDHQTAPDKITEKNWFFKLSDYGSILKEKILSGELSIEPDFRQNEVIAFIDQGLEDIAISRQNVNLALNLPWDDSQTIYVWLDELWSYYTAADDYWPADLHLIGKDILKFHAVIWPALLLAVNKKLPKRIFAHGFFTVNGQKISKSLGNAIDPIELADQYGSDTLRYYILRDIPFGNDGDFSIQRLEERYNSDLANGLGNLVSRTLNMIEKFSPDLLPQSVTDIDLTSHLETLSFDQALQTIWHKIAETDVLIEETKPWELAKTGNQAQIDQTLQTALDNLFAITTSLAPFLPDTHAKLTNILNSQPLKKPAEPLFPRL